MLSDTPISVNSPSVISEVLDGEAIIVNLDSGAYYSLIGAGADIWSAVQTGMTLAAAIAWVADRHAGAPQQIATDVTALIEELLTEGLAVAGATFATPAADQGIMLTPPLAGRPPFVKPILQKYTDMADLLLLDPIHEVDEQGWPHPAPRA